MQHIRENTTVLSKLGEYHYRVGEKYTALDYFSKVILFMVIAFLFYLLFFLHPFI